VRVALVNQGKLPFTVKMGERIAQLLLEKADTPPSQEVTTLPPTVRGEGGFGHTGVSAIAMGGTTNIPPLEERYARLRKVVPECYHDYLDVFDSDLCSSKLAPRRPGYDFKINLVPGSKLPPPACPYHLSREETRILDEWIDRMLATGMISKCDIKTPLAAPVFFVKKKDGNKQPCIDYRRLNEITIRDSYPLPCIDQIMDQVRGSKIFPKFDMKSSYNQIRIKEGHEYLTTFITHRGPFQSNVLGFGQMNAPPFFQRFMDDHIYRRPELVLHLVGYIDDANTHNANTPDHIRTNCHFFQRCRETGIHLNPKKCEFHKEKIDFLGVELLEKGFEMESVKTQAIHDWQPPRNVRGVREFIGFCNFYRRFIKGFAEIARPLHDLTRIDHKWQWGPLQQTSFQKLKNTVASTPVLIHANPDKPFQIETDTSAYAYGAVLSQKGQDSRYHPVGFFSKSMTPPERNYGISD
jgi:hypothetical protein